MRPLSTAVFVACVLSAGSTLLQSRSPGARPTTKAPSTGAAERLESLERRVAELELRVLQLETAQQSVVMDPVELSGYQRIRTDNGSFLVSLKNVEPFLDGVRVTMWIGNPWAARYRGFTLTLCWGPRPPEDPDAYGRWYLGLSVKELHFTETLESGAWTQVSFVLSPAPPAQFGYLRVSMNTNVVSLRAPEKD